MKTPKSAWSTTNADAMLKLEFIKCKPQKKYFEIKINFMGAAAHYGENKESKWEIDLVVFAPW